jgi:hypothetical protein
LPPLTRLLFVFHAAGAVHGEARIFTSDLEALAAFKALTWFGHSLETGEMPVRTIDRPNWPGPDPTSVWVSAVDHALPQIDTAAPKPSTVWNLVALSTVMSAVAGGPVVGVMGGVVVGPPVGVVPPVQAAPLTAKLVGAGLLPGDEPLKPNEVVPPVGMLPL